MEYRRLGKSGLKLSELSFGSWVTFGTQIGLREATDLMTLAFDAGVNFFDNAEVYAQGESERLMGQAFKKLGWSRESFCVSSKVFWGGTRPTENGLSAKHVVEGCHAALRRLSVDYLDLYFCHRPDPETPILETVRAMHTLILQGKVLYWGTSEWAAPEIAEAFHLAEKYGLTPPTMEQPQYNLFHRDRVETEYRPLCAEHGLGTTIWSPLASGILTGKYNDGIPTGSRMTLKGYEWLRARMESADGKKQIDQTRALSKLSGELEMTPAQLAISWCLLNPNVSTVILGATTAVQLRETLGTCELKTRLVPDVEKRIREIVES